MLRTTFGEVRINARFYSYGEWYIKVDPRVSGLNVFFNAVLADDEMRMFWFQDADIVEQ